MRTLIALVLIAEALAGCASSSGDGWTKPGATPKQVGQDTNDCLVSAQTMAPTPQGPRVTVDQTRYQRCMQDRGYSASPAK
jgi:hypothetical protein